MSQNEARLRQIQETLESDAELEAARRRLQSVQTDLHTAEHERRTSEARAQELQGRIKQAENRLYGGTVQNPKELQDLQADVASLKKQLGTIEDQELQAMMQADAAQAAVLAAEEQLKSVQARLQGDHRKLLEERSLLSRDQESLSAERQAAVSAVAAQMLDTYEGLRQQRHGVAVAEVAENACGACGTVLTAALQQSARHASQLVFCPSCGRILFAS